MLASAPAKASPHARPSGRRRPRRLARRPPPSPTRADRAGLRPKDHQRRQGRQLRQPPQPRRPPPTEPPQCRSKRRPTIRRPPAGSWPPPPPPTSRPPGAPAAVDHHGSRGLAPNHHQTGADPGLRRLKHPQDNHLRQGRQQSQPPATRYSTTLTRPTNTPNY